MRSSVSLYVRKSWVFNKFKRSLHIYRKINSSSVDKSYFVFGLWFRMWKHQKEACLSYYYYFKLTLGQKNWKTIGCKQRRIIPLRRKVHSECSGSALAGEPECVRAFVAALLSLFFWLAFSFTARLNVHSPLNDTRGDSFQNCQTQVCKYFPP